MFVAPFMFTHDLSCVAYDEGMRFMLKKFHSQVEGGQRAGLLPDKAAL